MVIKFENKVDTFFFAISVIRGGEIHIVEPIAAKA